MKTLRECLQRAGLGEHEAAILRGIEAEHRRDGASPRAAAMKAVREYMATAAKERADVAAEVKRRTGIDVGPGPDAELAPMKRQKEKPAPAAKAEPAQAPAAENARAKEKSAPAPAPAKAAEAAEEPQAPDKGAPPPEPPKDAGQGKTDDEPPQPSGSGGTLYGGLPLDAMAKAVAEAWGWSVKMAKPMLLKAGSIAEDIVKGVTGSVWRSVRYLVEGIATDMRAKTSGSPTAQALIDMFHTKAGSDRVTGETYEQAIRAKQHYFSGKLQAALGDIADNEAMLRQVVNQVRSGNFARGTKIGDAAAKLAALLKEVRAYMVDAGVELGEVRDGYYPRESKTDAVLQDPKGFEDALAKAYQENGLDAQTARLAAAERALSEQFGSMNAPFLPDKGNVRTPFMKGRVFGKSVDSPNHPLNRFLEADPAVNIMAYVTRATRRAELARRFGDDWAKFEDMMRKVAAEGHGQEIADLKDFVSIAAGLTRPGTSPRAALVAARLRVWATLMFLEKATLSSLSEFMVPVIRSGNVLDVARSLRNTVADLTSKKFSASAKERRAFAEDMLIIGDKLHDRINAARFSGGEPETMKQSMILDKFFRRTGLTQLTEAQRVSAADIARVYVRRQLKALGDGSNLAKRNLAELGVPFQKMQAFAQAVLAKRDGLPESGDVVAMPKEMADLYRVAMRRFVAQGIQEPDATYRPKWQTKGGPLGAFGALVGQLQSFNYAFYENVIKRQARLIADAANPATVYSMGERAKMLSAFVTMPMLYAVGLAVSEGRDALLGDPEKREKETAQDKALKALSRSIPVAPVDPILNYISSARYQRSFTDFVAGPFLGTAGRGLDAARDVMVKNSPNTNSQERRAAKAFYDIAIEPTVNLLLSKAPGGFAAQAAAAAATQVAGSGKVREAFVTEVAGKAKQKKGEDSLM